MSKKQSNPSPPRGGESIHTNSRGSNRPPTSPKPAPPPPPPPKKK